jgi:8-oxo-dGTP diphosphatase
MRIEVKILPASSVPADQLVYVVLGARYGEKWIFVRHRERITWEMPAGHIEAGETPDEAAGRELFEETGAGEFHLQHICDYSVCVHIKLEYGRLYLAEIESRSESLAFEIDEIRLEDDLPASLTYPEVQKLLFSEAKKYFRDEMKQL